MSNPFYSYDNAFIPGVLARAETVGAEFTDVQVGFQLLSYQGTDAGTANAYVVTTPWAPATNYTVDTGYNLVEFQAANSNTGASTININGIGAVGLRRWDGTPLQSGDIVAGAWYRAMYDGTYWRVVAPAAYTTTTGTISGDAPTHKVGLTAAAGTSTAVAPIDVTFAIDQSIAPTWTGAHTFSQTITAAAITASGLVTANGGATVNGALTVAPSSGVAVTVTGVSNSYGAVINGGSTTSESFGLKVQAGTNSSDLAVDVLSHAGTALLQVYGDGGVVVGSPTGGDEGAGKLNAVGLYVNGTAVSTATGANPSASVGLSAVNGSASTFMRSDGAPALSQAISPTWSGSHTFSNAVTVNGGGSSLKGGVTVTTPSSGTALTVDGISSGSTPLFRVTDGTVEVDVYTGGAGQIGTTSNHALELITDNAARFTISNVGAVTIAVPTSTAVALTVNGVAGDWTQIITGSATSGQSLGLLVEAGTNSSDIAFAVTNQADNLYFLKVRGDGLVQAVDAGNTLQTVGWRGCPQNVQNANYTLAISDQGKSVVNNSGTGWAYTVPSGVFTAGDVVTVVCAVSSGSLTISAGSGLTLYWANGTSTSGSRTLTGYGMATIYFYTSSIAYVVGSGLS